MVTDFKNLYSILGVEPCASKTAIKSAYRNLAKKYHPDMNKGNKTSEQKFKEIKEAYEILSDDQKRKAYDFKNKFNQFENKTKSSSNSFKAQSEYKKTSYHSSEKKVKNNKDEEFFKEHFAKFVHDIFTQKEPLKKPIKGKDIYTVLTLNIVEAQFGTTRKINILHSEKCPFCFGKKFINNTKCPKCNGTGEISSYKNIIVKIPAGTVENNEIIIKKEGEKGNFGGENGNLILKIKIEKNNNFRFSGLNVLSDIPITPTEAAIGTFIKINTIDGPINMKIPPETSSGQKFRLHGQGIFDKETQQKGDHIVTVFIKIPKNLSKQEKELYNKLAKLRDFNPRME